MAYLYNYLPMLWIVNTILIVIPYKNSAKINRFCSKNSLFLIILAKVVIKIFSQNANLGQSGLQNCVFFLLIICSKLCLKVFTNCTILFQKYKIVKLLMGAHIPSDTPVHSSVQLLLTCQQIIPPCRLGSTPLFTVSRCFILIICPSPIFTTWLHHA